MMNYKHRPPFAFGLIFLLAFLVWPPPAKAALSTSWVDTGYDVELRQARKAQSVNMGAYGARFYDIVNILRPLEHLAGPIEGLTVERGIWEKDPQYAQEMLNRSVLAQTTNLTLAMYANPPANLALWLQDTGQTLGFLPRQTHAQGIGFSGLSSLLSLWKIFRNLAYLFLAIIMIVVGFMVMMRKKIDPKTVVTVQNALPRIVLTLILITFSYAIVGLLIDAMYVIMVFVISLLVGASNSALGQNTPFEWTTSSFWVVIKALTGSFQSIDDIYKFLSPGAPAPGSISLANPVLTLWTLIGQAIGIVFAGTASGLFVLLLVLAILYMVIRIFFMLLNAYINIIVALLVGPLQILLDAVPGGNGFSSWFKNLVANIIVFPLTSFLIIIGYILMRSATGTTWTPPLLGTGSAGGAAGVIGLGILMIIPSIVNNIKEAMKAKAPIAAGPGAIFAPIGGVVQSGMSISQQFYYGKEGLKSIVGLIPGVKKPGAG